MRINVSVIQAKDEFELADKLSKDDREFFATQPIQKADGSWVAFCYMPQNKNTQRISEFQPPKTSFNKQVGTGSGDVPATKEQLNYIHKNNLDVDTKNLKKKEAWRIIKEHKEKK